MCVTWAAKLHVQAHDYFSCRCVGVCCFTGIDWPKEFLVAALLSVYLTNPARRGRHGHESKVRLIAHKTPRSNTFPTMSATGRLSLRLEEPGDDTLNDQVFGILQTTLQPDCPISLDTAVDQLVGLLPSGQTYTCLLYTSPSPRDGLLSRMPSSA